MPDKIPVKDNTTGAITWMWEVDAEEAVRNDATGTRYTPAASTAAGTSPRALPKKNPGGRGF